MRILFITHSFKKGGMERVVRFVYEKLKERGYDEKLILLRSEHSKFVDFTCPVIIDVYRGEKNSNLSDLLSKILSSFKGLFLFKKYLKRAKPDIVITLNPFETIIAFLCRSKRCYYKILCWYHVPFKSVWAKSPFWKVNKFFLRRVDGFLLINEQMKNELIKLIPNVKNLYVVRNPLLINSQKYISRDGKTFIYIGRFSVEKRVDLIIKAFSNLKSYDYKIVFIGDGELKSKIQDMAKELEIFNKTEWHEWTDDPWAKVKKACALLMTSDYEGLPLTLIEANWYGIPFVASNLDVVKDILVDGINGCTFKVGEVDDLTEKIRCILENKINFGQPHEIRKCVEKFEASKVINNIENALKAVFSK